MNIRIRSKLLALALSVAAGSAFAMPPPPPPPPPPDNGPGHQAAAEVRETAHNAHMHMSNAVHRHFRCSHRRHGHLVYYACHHRHDG